MFYLRIFTLKIAKYVGQFRKHCLTFVEKSVLVRNTCCRKKEIFIH
jgi:hypothetical protein